MPADHTFVACRCDLLAVVADARQDLRAPVPLCWIVALATIEALLFPRCFHAALHLRFHKTSEYVLERFSPLVAENRRVRAHDVRQLCSASVSTLPRQRAGKFALGRAWPRPMAVALRS